MPRLPSAIDIQRSVPNPQRGVVGYRAGIAEAAMQDLGQEGIRAGARIQSEVGQQNTAQSKIEAAYAKSHYLRGQVGLEQKYSEDQDYTTISARYSEDATKLRAEAANLIKDPAAREMFNAELEPTFASGNVAIQKLAREKEGSYARASGMETISANEQAIAAAKDEPTRAALMRANQETITGLRDKGWITPEQAVTQQKASATRMAQTYAASLPPSELRKLLQPTSGQKQAAVGDDAILDQIAQIESQGNPNAVNPQSGAAGLFQFMPETAKQYGLTDPKDPIASREAAGKLLADNRASLARDLGREPTPGELYLAHQQGPGGAAALLKNPDRAAVAALTPVYGDAGKAQAAITQNGGTLDMTAGEFAGKWTSKVGDTLQGSAGNDTLSVTTEKTGTPLDILPLEERQTLLKQAIAQEAAGNADAEKAAKAQQAAFTSDLEIKVNRGEASYIDIENAYAKGLISPAKRTQLTLGLDADTLKKQGDAASMMKVASGIPLDPKNKEDRKALNTYFDATVQQWNEQKLTPQQQLDHSVQFAAERGIVPDTMKGMIRGAMRSGNPDQMVGAAETVRRIKNANVRTLDDFGKEDLRLAETIGALTDLGYSNKDAIDRSMEILSRPKQVDDTIDTTIRDYNKDNKPAEYIQDELSHWYSASPDIPPGMISDFNQVVKEEYARSGNIDIARKMALNQLGVIWQPSNVGGTSGYSRQSPEKVYGVAGMNQEQNAEWMNEQLLQDFTTNTLIDPNHRLSADDIFIKYDPTSGSDPKYIVNIKTDSGLWEQAERWAPDWQTSPAFQRQQKALDQKVNDARDERAGVLKGRREQKADAIMQAASPNAPLF